MKHLYRSQTNKIFAGVLGGIGEYFAVDPVIIRLAYVTFTAVTGVAPGVVIYLVAIFVVPKTISNDGVIDVEIVEDKPTGGS